LETTQSATRTNADLRPAQFRVRCKTCNVSRSFLTPQGANAFTLEHVGHETIDSRYEQVERVPDEAQRNPAPKPKQEVEGALLPQVVQTVESRPEPIVAPAAPAPQSEKDLKEPLLLAKSSYIEESDEKRREALTVSRALREFRWNVEPPYVIGVMVDDNVSVETNIGVISSSVVERMGRLGYAFTAINAPQGSPVAWFKKKSGADHGLNLPVAEAERTMQMKQETRTYDKDKAVWEESFLSLLMTVKDMDGRKLKDVTNILKSTERPQPDLR